MPIITHGLSNLAEGVGASDGNYARDVWQYRFGDNAGKNVYFVADVASGVWSANTSVLTGEARFAISNDIVAFSARQAGPIYATDYIKNYTTKLGGAAAINDLANAFKGIYDQYVKE